MLADLEGLTGLGERTTQNGQARAAEFLADRLSPLGLEVRKLSYSYKTGSFANLEASLPGELADRYVFVGAHYDAVTGSPGADDDASGTVAVLEMARALAGCKLKRTVRFLFFSNEEQGTVGSTQYVKSLVTAVPPAQLIAYLNLDMIGYARPGESLDVASRPAYGALVDQVAAAVTRWSSLPVKKVVNDQCG
jgi:acetylornithine deacetylase/succinyl-diaminopimelate desuccinylase-like protein